MANTKAATKAKIEAIASQLRTAANTGTLKVDMVSLLNGRTMIHTTGQNGTYLMIEKCVVEVGTFEGGCPNVMDAIFYPAYRNRPCNERGPAISNYTAALFALTAMKLHMVLSILEVAMRSAGLFGI